MYDPTIENQEPLDRQLRQLIECFNLIARRLLPDRPPTSSPEVELSRQETKAIFVLGRMGQVIMSDLAKNLNLALSTATNTIDKLVAKELVERGRVDEDRRIVQVALSDKGRHVYEAFRECQLAIGRGMLEALSPGEREIFLELMIKITQSQPSVTEHEMEPAARAH